MQLIPSFSTRFKIRLALLTCLLLLTALSACFAWQYFGQKRLVIDLNGSIREIRSNAATVQEALTEAEIYLDLADTIKPPLDTRTKSGMTIVITKANQLVLEIDGQTQRIYTHTANPLLILREQNIVLQLDDELYVNHRLINWHNPPIFSEIPNHLRIVRAHSFKIYDNGQLITNSTTTAATVGEVLDEYNLTLYLADTIAPQLETPITRDLVINISRSSPVTIRVDNRQIHTRSNAATVADVLNLLGLALSGQDYSIPPENTPFTPNMQIEIVRVIESVEIEQESVPYEIISLPDTSLPIGTEKVIQTGVTGIQETRVLIRRENNLIVSRIPQSTWLTVPPIPQIIAYNPTD